MKYELIERLPNAEEYNHLRQLVGWSVYKSEEIVRALHQTLYCVCAMMDSVIVGMARVIGDGGLAFYIQDVIVHPDYQRQKIGT